MPGPASPASSLPATPFLPLQPRVRAELLRRGGAPARGAARTGAFLARLAAWLPAFPSALPARLPSRRRAARPLACWPPTAASARPQPTIATLLLAPPPNPAPPPQVPRTWVKGKPRLTDHSWEKMFSGHLHWRRWAQERMVRAAAAAAAAAACVRVLLLGRRSHARCTRSFTRSLDRSTRLLRVPTTPPREQGEAVAARSARRRRHRPPAVPPPHYTTTPDEQTHSPSPTGLRSPLLVPPSVPLPSPLIPDSPPPPLPLLSTALRQFCNRTPALGERSPRPAGTRQGGECGGDRSRVARRGGSVLSVNWRSKSADAGTGRGATGAGMPQGGPPRAC